MKSYAFRPETETLMCRPFCLQQSLGGHSRLVVWVENHTKGQVELKA